MDNTQAAQAPALTGQVLFYKNPQPLTPEKHGGLGVKQVPEPFAFLRTSHAIPLTISEFGTAAASYPIIFVGTDLTPVAVMGIRQDENLFVTEAGQIEPDFYAPAFVRRYPFVFANDDKGDRLLLCVDRDAAMVSNQPEVPFFKDGQPTEFTQNAIEFCKEFERQRRATVDFTARLKALDIFSQKTVSFQPRDQQGKETGPAQKIADYWGVDEEKLNALSDEKYNELRTSGALPGIYAHMVSLLNWNRVIQRAARKQEAKPTTSDVGQA